MELCFYKVKQQIFTNWSKLACFHARSVVMGQPMTKQKNMSKWCPLACVLHSGLGSLSTATFLAAYNCMDPKMEKWTRSHGARRGLERGFYAASPPQLPMKRQKLIQRGRNKRAGGQILTCTKQSDSASNVWLRTRTSVKYMSKRLSREGYFSVTLRQNRIYAHKNGAKVWKET